MDSRGLPSHAVAGRVFDAGGCCGVSGPLSRLARRVLRHRSPSVATAADALSSKARTTSMTAAK